MSAETIEHRDMWKNIDDCIDKWFSQLHRGAFDPEMFDKDKLQQIKEEYGNGPIVLEEPYGILELFMILSKCGMSSSSSN